MMPAMVIPKKVKSRGRFISLASIKPSGMEMVTVAVIKASAEPIGTPLLTKASTIGTTPTELAYNGAPSKTADGTAAQALYNEIIDKRLDYGCLEVSLRFLGAELNFSDVDRQSRATRSLTEAIERRGFVVNWMMTVNQDNFFGDFSSSDVMEMLSGMFNPEENYPDSVIAGYLLIIYLPDEPNHVVSILPPEDLKPEKINVMDTLAGGHLHIGGDDIAFLLNFVMSNGGEFELVQLKRSDSPYR